MTILTTPINIPSDVQAELAALRAENVKLTRKNIRLQDTLDRNMAAAESSAAIAAMQIVEKQRQEQYLMMLLENCPCIVLLFDKTGHLAYCTKNFLKLSGIGDSIHINGQLFHDIFYRFADKDWVDHFSVQLRQAVENAKPLEQEIRLNISGVQERIYVLQCRPSLRTESALDGVVMMLNDVTDIRLAQQKAEQGKTQAEQASVAKSVFLSNMSHEIRTPMNAIIGMTALAKETGEEKRKQYYLSKIEEASTHLLGVINDILDISKIEANKFELSPSIFHFEKMMQRVVNIINFRIEEKNLNFTVYLDRHIPAVIESDEQHLAQVITNLLSNAVKFTPELGEIRLAARLIAEHNNVCTIQISVSDSGIGIPKESQDRIFNSFEQTDSSISRKFGGTGLGLTISKRIVEMMGGTIWVESVPGKGATFAFTMKAHRCQEQNVSGMRLDVTVENLRLLVVDDSPEVLEYFSILMEKYKIHFDVADSGKAACEKIASEGGYDMYFIDWKMPGMDGIELTRIIKKHGTDQSVIVMISSTEWTQIERNARSAGVDHFLQKPVLPSAIIDCINTCIGLPGTTNQIINKEGIFEGHRILIAEDVKINREIILAQLASTKVGIDCAVNGLEAVERFKESGGKYDLILMDMQMPELDGIEATMAIRDLNVPDAKTIPIIALTANVFRDDIEKCLEAGMNDHLGKPIEFPVMLKKLKSYLDKQ